MFRDDVIGLLCSALYTLSIFRVFRLLSTGAVGEGSAFTFLPLVIYGIYLVFEANTQDRDFRNSWIILGLGYAGLIQTHVLSCEITAMAAILFCLCYLPRLFEKERFLKCVQGAFFSLGLSIWYLVPFLDYYMTQDVKIRHASARTIQNRGVTFFQELHTFWSIQDMAAEGREQYVYPTGPGMFLIFGVVVFFILLFIGVLRKENGSEKRLALRSAVLGCGFLWMATDRFPWDRLQAASGIASSLISSLQFPYRFIGWATILCVTVVGYLFLFFKKNTKTYYCVSLMIAAISIAVPLPYLYLIDAKDAAENALYLYNEEGMGFGYISGEEYLIYGTDSASLTFAKPETPDGIEIMTYSKKGLRTEFFCENSSESQKLVKLPILLYKGYTAFGNEGEQLEIMDDGSHILSVCVPAGFRGQIVVTFIEPWYWRAAELITLFTVVLFVIWMTRGFRFSDGSDLSVQSGNFYDMTEERSDV